MDEKNMSRRDSSKKIVAENGIKLVNFVLKSETENSRMQDNTPSLGDESTLQSPENEQKLCNSELPVDVAKQKTHSQTCVGEDLDISSEQHQKTSAEEDSDISNQTTANTKELGISQNQQKGAHTEESDISQHQDPGSESKGLNIPQNQETKTDSQNVNLCETSVSTEQIVFEPKVDGNGINHRNNNTGDNEGATNNEEDPYCGEDEKTYAQIEKQFRAVSGPDGALNKETFKKALQVKKSFFADRLFQLFDDDNSGSIDLNELLQGLQKLTKGTPTEKLQFLFNIYDVDHSGTIDRGELRTVLQSCMEESSLHLSEENLDALTNALFDDADTDKSGSITFEELKSQLDKHPDVMNNLTISAAQWLSPPKKKKKPITMPRHLTWTYLQNNRVKVCFTAFYLLLNAGLYFLNCWLYRESNWYIIFARGAGMCLNFNCAFVLVLMLRYSLTFLRNTPLVKILPFDQHVMFHKLTGYAIVIFTLIHTAMHLGNAAVFLTDSTGLNVAEILFTLKAGIGWIDGFAPLSGVILTVIVICMFICSMDFVRRSGCFQVFYWTHKLYIPFFILNILHGANFWKWIVGPGLIFCIELVLRMQWIRDARHGAMYIETVNLLPSGVTELRITRPPSFGYKSGDYVFLRIPVIARYEWHPFTISSAPEMPGVFTVHVRSAGHWTKLLYSYFEEIISNGVDPESGQATNGRDNWKVTSLKDAMSFRRRNTKARKMNESRKKRVKSAKVRVPVNVDGPYGTPSRHIFDAEHAVLIGSGIGVTPFASILQSIMYRFREAEVSCPSCQHRFCTEIPKTVMSLKKVDFVWINRDQRNFEWFLTLLTKLEREQSRDTGLGHVLEMHMYMTSALTKKDMKGIGLQMALDLIHETEKTDLVTGLQTRTQPGRPDWDKLFSSIAANAKGKVQVFFCGAPILARTLKAVCSRHSFGFHQETF